MKRVIILFSAFTQLLFMLPLSAQESRSRFHNSDRFSTDCSCTGCQAFQEGNKVFNSGGESQGGAIGYAFNGASEIFDAETQYVGTDS